MRNKRRVFKGPVAVLVAKGNTSTDDDYKDFRHLLKVTPILLLALFFGRSFFPSRSLFLYCFKKSPTLKLSFLFDKKQLQQFGIMISLIGAHRLAPILVAVHSYVQRWHQQGSHTFKEGWTSRPATSH